MSANETVQSLSITRGIGPMAQTRRHSDRINGPFRTRLLSFLLLRLRGHRPDHGGVPARAVSPARALLVAGALAMAGCSAAVAAESTFDAPAAQRQAREIGRAHA